MKFIDVAIPKFGDDAPATTSVQPVLRRNTRPAAIEEYNLHDHDHDHDLKLEKAEHDHAMDHEDGKSVKSLRRTESRDSSVDGEVFHEAQDDTTEVSLAVRLMIAKADSIDST
jgi:hypothetical protein